MAGTVQLHPYLHFRDGQARAAVEFYAAVFGGTPELMTFERFGTPEGTQPDWIMHGYLGTDRGFGLMVSDVPPQIPTTPGTAMRLSLSGTDADVLRGYWTALSEGATIETPLEKQMWGDEFGSLVDRFGVGWLVDIGQG